MFSFARQSLQFDCNATLSDPMYSEIWRRMRLCWAPCLGKQGQAMIDMSGFGITGVPSSSNVTWGDGYPFTYVETGTNIVNPSENVKSNSGTMDLSTGFIWEIFLFTHTNASSGVTSYIDFTANSGTANYFLQSTNLTTGSWAPSTGGGVVLGNSIGGFIHLVWELPLRTSLAAGSQNVAGMNYKTGLISVGTSIGNQGGGQAATVDKFNYAQLGRRAALNTALPARYSFWCVYERPGFWDRARMVRRLTEPFKIFGMNSRPNGKAAATAAQLAGRPFPWLPQAVLVR